MTLEAELINSLSRIQGQITSLTKTVDAMAGKIAVPIQETTKATKAMADSMGVVEKMGGQIGKAMIAQFRSLIVQSIGVTAVFGAITSAIDEHNRKMEEATAATLKWGTATRGIIPNTPALRESFGRNTGVKPEQAPAVLNEWLKAGGRKDPASIKDFGSNVMAPGRLYGIDPSLLARFGGMASKAGLPGQAALDVLGYIQNTGMPEDKVSKITPQSFRSLARRSPGQWNAYKASVPVTPMDEKLAAIERGEANVAWDQVSDVSVLDTRLNSIRSAGRGKPWLTSAYGSPRRPQTPGFGYAYDPGAAEVAPSLLQETRGTATPPASAPSSMMNQMIQQVMVMNPVPLRPVSINAGD